MIEQLVAEAGTGVKSAETSLTEVLTPPSASAELSAPSVASETTARHDLAFLNEVVVDATVELGRTRMSIRDVLKLHRGSVIELDKLVGQPAELLINNTALARGEIIVVNERFGFKITQFVK